MCHDPYEFCLDEWTKEEIRGETYIPDSYEIEKKVDSQETKFEESISLENVYQVEGESVSLLQGESELESDCSSNVAVLPSKVDKVTTINETQILFVDETNNNDKCQDSIDITISSRDVKQVKQTKQTRHAVYQHRLKIKDPPCRVICTILPFIWIMEYHENCERLSLIFRAKLLLNPIILWEISKRIKYK